MRDTDLSSIEIIYSKGRGNANTVGRPKANGIMTSRRVNALKTQEQKEKIKNIVAEFFVDKNKATDRSRSQLSGSDDFANSRFHANSRPKFHLGRLSEADPDSRPDTRRSH